MKQTHLWQLSASFSADAEEAMLELLQRVLGLPVTVEVDWETRRMKARVILTRRELWSEARQREFQKGVALLREIGLQSGPARASLRRIRHENWAESWKRHFKPIEVGGALLVKPSWARRQPKPGQALVVLDPGLSFGTGRHATTGYCLKQLVARRIAGSTQAFLDAGSGSGILAISAAKLGYRPVHAFDFDPDAVRIARENGKSNGVRVPFRREDLTLMRPEAGVVYDVVCANLMADLLLAQKRKLVKWTRPGGMLILAGILTTQFDEVCRAYEAAGLRLVDSCTEGEWRSGSFERPLKPRARR